MDVPIKNFKAQIIASGSKATWAEKLSALVNDRPWEACAHLAILLLCAIVLWRTPLYDSPAKEDSKKAAAEPVEAESKPKGKFYAKEGKFSTPDSS